MAIDERKGELVITHDRMTLKAFRCSLKLHIESDAPKDGDEEWNSRKKTIWNSNGIRNERASERQIVHSSWEKSLLSSAEQSGESLITAKTALNK